MTEQSRAATTDESWLTDRERGTLWLIKFTVRLATLFGRWPMKPIVALIALWYFAFDRRARAASRGWLTRALTREPGPLDVYRHIHCFAQATLDRVFFVSGRTRPFEVTRTGNHHLIELAAEGRGAVLLGAHLGSFEAMRAGGQTESFPIRIVGHFENARMINALLEGLDPDASARVIHAGREPIDFALTVRQCVDAGEMVAILGDRVGLNERAVTVPFFGEPARFPTGPFLLASTLRCPVLLVFGLYEAPNRYALHCEPLSDRIILPRGDRESALRHVVGEYAARLEEYARRAPYNWFNFYDFWHANE